MSLFSHLEKIKTKPEHFRRKYAFGVSLGITSLIFLFWLGSISSNSIVPKSAVSSAVAKVEKPGERLIAGVGNLFDDLKDMVFGPKKVSYPKIEVRPGR